jgi:hypothetical protein
VSPCLLAPKISQTYTIRESYKDTISPTRSIFRGGNNFALNLSITLEVNSPSSQRIINFLKCLSILSYLPEDTLEKAVFQLENIRNNACQESVHLQSLDCSNNKYSSSPRIASLVGNLEKDYESFCSNYPKTVETAQKLIDLLHSVALTNNWWWYVPLLNICDHEIVLEWWNQSKKITTYVSEESIDYIKVWGADMDNEMEDGSISLEEDLTHLWQWIAS